MTIQLTSSNGNLLLPMCNDFNKANQIAKALIRKGYSDVYYIIEQGELSLEGSIDLEPQSFHAPHLNKVVTNHLETWLGNVSKLTANWQFNEKDIQLFKSMYSCFKHEQYIDSLKINTMTLHEYLNQNPVKRSAIGSVILKRKEFKQYISPSCVSIVIRQYPNAVYRLRYDGVLMTERNQESCFSIPLSYIKTTTATSDFFANGNLTFASNAE